MLSTRSIARRFSLLNTVPLLNGVDSLGLTHALTPANSLHVAAGTHLFTPTGFGLSLLRSCDSLVYFGLDTLGLGIGSTILLTSTLIKLPLMPIAVVAQRHINKNSSKLQEMQDLQFSIMTKKAPGMHRALEDDKRKLALIKKSVKTPFFVWLRFLEFPFHLLALCSISRKILAMYKAGASGSALKFLWINNVLLPDPTFILPILTGGATFIAFLMAGKSMSGMFNMLPGGSIAKFVIPLMGSAFLCYMPAYVCLYSIGVAGMTALGTGLADSKWFSKITGSMAEDKPQNAYKSIGKKGKLKKK